MKCSEWVVCVVVLFAVSAKCEPKNERIVNLSQGPVRGYKDLEHDLFEFHGIPYATAPTGPHKFKAPLPAPSWTDTLDAVDKFVVCPQIVFPNIVGPNVVIKEDCLIANVFVPDTNETNLPVLVIVHGGGFEIGLGNCLTSKKLVQSKKMIVVTFNYRLGFHGFLCLGTEDAPGNAGMKDQVALLRWVSKNIASFGGNPNDVTLSGSSAGSISVDLLILSPTTKGLFKRVIPESGASLSESSVQLDPVNNARKHAKLLNFTDVDDIYALENFYKTTPLDDLFTDTFMTRSENKLPFTPCVETKTSEEPFLVDSPYNILKSGNYVKVPMLYGFANMEGLLRVNALESWKDKLNEKFSNFIPADLKFKNDEEKESVAKKVKEYYFGDKLVGKETVLQYIDFFSDIMFTYSTLWALKLQVEAGNDKIYLYEYSFTDDKDDYFKVPYTDNVRGADHTAQTMAVSDANTLYMTSEDEISEEYKKNKADMRELWTNFIVTGTPVPEGSRFPAWPPAGASASPHMSLGRTIELRDALLPERARFWHDIYEKHYSGPRPPPTPPPKHADL